MARHIPVFPSGLSDVGNVLGFMSRLVSDRNQVDRQALIDRKTHSAAIVVSLRRVVRFGALSCQG